jgi:Mg2+/Co2+ transporter CorB
MSSVRELNRSLGLNLPIEGPKTINGLVLEALQDIPDASVSVKIGQVPIEILQLQGRMIRRVKVFRPLSAEASPPAASPQADEGGAS